MRVNCLCNKSKQSLEHSQSESIEKTLFYSLIHNINKKSPKLYDFLIKNWKEVPITNIPIPNFSIRD